MGGLPGSSGSQIIISYVCAHTEEQSTILNPIPGEPPASFKPCERLHRASRNLGGTCSSVMPTPAGRGEGAIHPLTAGEEDFTSSLAPRLVCTSDSAQVTGELHAACELQLLSNPGWQGLHLLRASQGWRLGDSKLSLAC